MIKSWLCFACLVFVSAAGAENPWKVGEKAPIPETGFADSTELAQWSAHSTLGGGMCERLPTVDIDVYCTRRMVTSGVATTELVFWKKSGGRLVPCLVMPVRRGGFRVAMQGRDVVVVRDGSGPAHEVEVLRLHLAFFAEEGG